MFPLKMAFPCTNSFSETGFPVEGSNSDRALNVSFPKRLHKGGHVFSEKLERLFRE